MNILLVSNGYGEAAIAGYLGREIRRLAPDATVEHFPLVGRFETTGRINSTARSENAPLQPRVIGPQADMPSGGLVAYWNVGNLARDIGAGLLGLTARQFRFLAQQKSRDVVVAIGDVYCLAAALLFARRPTIFVATAKSEQVAPHSALEYAIARHARVAFARDEATARALERHGVNARYAGNLMMDGVGAHEVDLPIRDDALHVGVLPGSRRDAPANVAAALRRLELLARDASEKPVQAFVSLAPSVALADVIGASASTRPRLEPTGASNGVVARGSDGRLDVLVVAGAFGDLVRSSDVVLGQSGTGNEQAAGCGKPVIASSPGGEGSVGWYRMRQQRLLGEALLVLPDDDRAFSEGMAALLADPARMQMMAATGRARMGASGGSEAVAKAVLALASEQRR